MTFIESLTKIGNLAVRGLERLLKYIALAALCMFQFALNMFGNLTVPWQECDCSWFWAERERTRA